ncbi:hypothetical protein N9C22_03360 [Paracoccaceae bacterium]|nr:hypothetical protein [Paracoccaceae bacterium]
MFDDNVEVEVKAEAYDRDKDIVLIYAEIRVNVIIGPEPMFMKTVMCMQFILMVRK